MLFALLTMIAYTGWWFDLPYGYIVDGLWLPGVYLAVAPFTGEILGEVFAGPATPRQYAKCMDRWHFS